MTDFEQQVLSLFRQMLERGDLRVHSITKAEVFDNAAVTLEADDFLLRIVRERGVLAAEFASRAQGGNWFDATIVGELFENRPETSFMDVNGAIILERFARFVQEHFAELAQLFTARNFDATRRELERLRRESVKRRFGV